MIEVVTQLVKTRERGLEGGKGGEDRRRGWERIEQR